MAVLDVVTLTEAKTMLHVGATDTSQEATLTRLITAMSLRLDKAFGPIVRRNITDERHNGGNCAIELRQSPAFSITTVVEYDQNGTATTLTEETHLVKPANAWLGERYEPDPTLYSGLLIRRASGGDTFYTWGRNNVLVTYVGGRFADTAGVDARYKEAAALMLKNWWRSYQESTALVGEFEVPQQMFATFAIPNAVYELLHDVRQPEIGFGA